MDAEICELSPPDWTVQPIAEVCERVTSGGTPSRRHFDYFADGTYGWVKTQELRDTWIDSTGEQITEEAIKMSSAKLLPSNTILLALYGATVGQLGILRRPMTCNQACCALIVDCTKADYRYVFYQLLFARPQLKRLATGAAQQNLSGLLMKSFRLPFSPLPEQRAIAHILGTLDDKIELNRRMNETLEAMARALFKSWFVDFDTVRAKMDGRQPAGMDAATAALFSDKLVHSELGLIPEEWSIAKLRDTCRRVENGGTPKRDVKDFWDLPEIPWLTSGEVRKRFITTTDASISQLGLANSSAKLWPPFTSVVALYGATAGFSCLLGREVSANQACCALIPTEHTSAFNYLTVTLSLTHFPLQTRGSAQQNVSQSLVADLPIVLSR
jgi:type I restriction enzyme S subunit